MSVFTFFLYSRARISSAHVINFLSNSQVGFFLVPQIIFHFNTYYTTLCSAVWLDKCSFCLKVMFYTVTHF